MALSGRRLPVTGDRRARRRASRTTASGTGLRPSQGAAEARLTSKAGHGTERSSMNDENTATWLTVSGVLAALLGLIWHGIEIAFGL